ncbi:cadherin-like domain-containing protein, partial [Vreelandella aquamarina]
AEAVTSAATESVANVNDAPVINDVDSGGEGEGGAISTYTITEGPVDTALSLDSGETVDVGLYYGNTSNASYLDKLEAFYNEQAGMRASVIDQRFDGSTPEQDLLVIFQPPEDLNSLELDTLGSYLDGGGRIFFVGEHQGYKPAENENISQAITALGGNIAVLGGSYYDPDLDNTGTPLNLNKSPLTAGVDLFTLAAHAQLEIDSAISQAIMTDSEQRIVMADQALSKGRITVIADQNWLDSDNSVFLRNMAIDSARNIKTVEEGGDPNSDFVAPSGLEETNTGLTTDGSLTVTDPDPNDTVTVSATSVTVTQKNADGNTQDADAAIPGDEALLAMMEITPSPVLDNTITSGELTWAFDSGDTTFDFLAKGETLDIVYTLTANDGNGGTANQDVTVTIEGTNDTPVLNNNKGFILDEGAAHTLTTSELQVMDIDNEAVELTYTLTGLTGEGTLSLDGTELSDSETFTQADIANGLLVYTHNGGEAASDSFSFSISDGTGGTIAATTTAITINPVNDAPTGSVTI